MRIGNNLINFAPKLYAMVTRETIREIIIDNRQQVAKREIISRNFNFMDNACYVLIGVRRAGKSYLLYQRIQQLIRNGHSWEEIVYINFEDERLLEMQAADLNKILEVHQMMTDKMPLLFLDEIQNITGWDKFARRLTENKYSVIVTGSNAKMLSREIETTLGGRFFTKYIIPYNFREFLRANDVDFSANALYSTKQKGRIIKHLETFITFGGFPESLAYNSKRDYVAGVFQKILLGDIVLRNSIRNDYAMKILIKKIAESSAAELSYTKLHNILKTIGISVGKESVINYISYAEDAYLIFRIHNFFAKFADMESTPKYYFSDNGLLNLFLTDKKTRLLENIVAVCLHQKYPDGVYYLKSPKTDIDIDFYVPEIETAIQVSYSISDEITKKREVDNLVALKQNFNGAKHFIIITYDEEDNVSISETEIQIIPVYKFLIQ